MSKLTLFDLDGTLCNDSHRKPAYDAQDWDTYWNYDSMMSDPAWEPGIAMFRQAEKEGDVGILSARLDDLNWDVTFNWLTKHDLHPAYTWLRTPEEEHLRPPEFKSSVLKTMILLGGYDEVVLVDNDPLVVAQITKDLGKEHVIQVTWEVEAGENV